MKIYLLRHGTTAWNQGRRIQGRTDIPLDGDGERLAVMTGEGMKNAGITFSRVFASPLVRSHKTAELAAPGMEIETDARLLELAFGTFEGREVSGMMADESQPFRFFHEDPARYDEALLELEKTAPDAGYESLTSLCARVKSFLDEIILPLAKTAPQDENILIAGHGAMNRAMMTVIQENALSDFWGSGLQPNCGVYLIDAAKDADGRVRLHAEEECRIFFDPAALPCPPELLEK